MCKNHDNPCPGCPGRSLADAEGMFLTPDEPGGASGQRNHHPASSAYPTDHPEPGHTLSGRATTGQPT